MTDLDPLQDARDIAAIILPRGDEIEAARRLPPDIADLMRSRGIFRQCIPKALGGREAHPLETLRVIEEIARGDGSTAWVAMVGCTTALLSGYFDDHWAKEIYGRDLDVISAGATAPTGRAVKVDGGIEVTGQWQWGSGCDYADWLVGGSLLVDESGELVLDEDGNPHHLLPLLAADQVEILDTWYVHGMAGSGSTDFTASGAFVPDGRWLRFGFSKPRLSGLYQFPLLGFLGLGVCSISLGVARRAIEELTALAVDKVPTASNKPLAMRGYVQSAVAEAEAAVRSARALLREAVDEAYDAANFFEHLGDGGKWLLFSAAPVRDETGEFIGAVETFEDMTEHTKRNRQFSMMKSIAHAEWDTLLFFYGVILCVGGLSQFGYLALVSELLYTDLGATMANSLVGVLSAIIDNIPVMFAVLTMDPAMSLGQWLLVTLTAGVGGSLLAIGSAAGVALLGAARGLYTFGAQLKCTPAIALGYVLRMYVLLVINQRVM
ncbi:MAG: hypothetical protein GY773_15065 [Actinomycetia bacterium]|nr:hypothetical protein [Actinomycetes bacterium]